MEEIEVEKMEGLKKVTGKLKGGATSDNSSSWPPRRECSDGGEIRDKDGGAQGGGRKPKSGATHNRKRGGTDEKKEKDGEVVAQLAGAEWDAHTCSRGQCAIPLQRAGKQWRLSATTYLREIFNSW
uniref:Uncharacterized protein n=1 Tax=Oryza barthii TaxID=65489 RepID=A0A0D3GRS8_9ORYZ